MEEFKIGDLVELLSGGPTMTVTDLKPVGDKGLIHCQWFGGKKLEWGRFPPAALKRVTEKKG